MRYPFMAILSMVVLCMSTQLYGESSDYSRDASYKGPTYIISTKDGKNIYVTEYDAGKVVKLETSSHKTVQEYEVSGTPTDICLTSDEKKLYVLSAPQGFLHIYDVSSGKEESKIGVGYCPESMVMSPDGNTVYVANRFSTDVSVVSIRDKKELTRIKMLREPMSLAITPDGKTVFVTNFLPLDPADGYDVASEVTWIDTSTNKTGQIRLLNGCVALHDIKISADGKYGFVTNNLARYQMPTTQLDRGWMNTNAVAILDCVEKKLINVILLDDIDLGAANLWGIQITPDDKSLLVAHGGTHELSIIDMVGIFDKLGKIPADKKAVEQGKRYGSGSAYNTATAADVPNDLAFLVGMRTRVKLSGNNPRHIALSGNKAYVSMYFSDTIAIVDLQTKKQVGEIALNPNFKISAKETPVRYGQRVFYDATTCYQQWQSCTTCHPYGHMDALNWDLQNDGLGNPKNAKPLLFSHETPPTMISGIRADAEACVRSGFKHILFSVRPEEEPESIDAYLKHMKPLPSPYLVEGKLSESAKRGEEIFKRVKCDICHPADSYYTDMQLHDVGTENSFDRRADWDTPTLHEVWRTAPYLHDGRYTTLRQLFKEGQHGKQKGDVDKLTDKEIDDLVEYVNSL